MMKALFLFAASSSALSPARSYVASRKSLLERKKHQLLRSSKLQAYTSLESHETDVVIVGGGLAGLCCGALLSHNGVGVTVLESHDVAGGAMHSWERKGFHFESGPSLYSGFSPDKSPNPLKHVFDILGNGPEWLTYDRWGTVIPEGRFACKIGPEEFQDVLDEFGGPGAREEFSALMTRMEPLTYAAQALPSLSLREDAGVLITAALRYPRGLLASVANGAQLTAPFADVLSETGTSNRFIVNWLNLLSFLLQGLPAKGTMNAVMAYMLADWYRPGVTLDFPKGGSGAIVAALVAAIEKSPTGRVVTNAHVDAVTIAGSTEKGAAVSGGGPAGPLRASGVSLRKGGALIQVGASRAVVCNADVRVTRRLVPRGVDLKLDKHLDDLAGIVTETKQHSHKKKGEKTNSNGGKDPETPPKSKSKANSWSDSPAVASGAEPPANLRSFIHLHAGISAHGLPTECSADFPAQWAVVRDWNAKPMPQPMAKPAQHPGTVTVGEKSRGDGDAEDMAEELFSGVEAPRNVVLVSVPSLIDPGLAPEGHHVLHAYVPATEPYEAWAGLDRFGPEYAAKKADAEAFLWDAVEEYIPDARQRAVPGTVQVGSPLTHERFLRRSLGSYGPRAVAGQGTLPGHTTPLPGLFLCGDFTFPGIGVPAAASSGAIVANTLLSVPQHLEMLRKIKLP